MSLLPSDTGLIGGWEPSTSEGVTGRRLWLLVDKSGAGMTGG